jgi:hypothetical protein
MTAGSLESGRPAQEAFRVAAASPEEAQVLLRRAIVMGSRFLLDTATLSVLSHYRGIPALKGWNAPLEF